MIKKVMAKKLTTARELNNLTTEQLLQKTCSSVKIIEEVVYIIML